MPILISVKSREEEFLVAGSHGQANERRLFRWGRCSLIPVEQDSLRFSLYEIRLCASTGSWNFYIEKQSSPNYKKKKNSDHNAYHKN